MYNKLQYFFTLFILSCPLVCRSGSFYFGSIKSTQTATLPSIPYYYRGNSGLLMPQKEIITFEIPADSNQKQLYILITDMEPNPITQKTDDGTIIINTFHHLELAHNANYRFFVFEQSDDGSWNIHEESLPNEIIIPDQTVILLYLPELIEKIDGGLFSELPTIYIRPLASLSDSTSLLEINDRILAMHMGVINLNTIHSPIKQLKHHHNKKILIASTYV